MKGAEHAMLKRMLLIVNPNSGTRQGLKRLGEIVSILQAGGFICTVMMTDRQLAASEFAFQHGRHFDVVACVGGDGTFNETVNGMLRAELSVPIGYIPTGSTNDFAASLKLPSDITSAAQIIAAGRTRRLDIGRFNDRNFSYVASFGAFTKTSYSTPQSMKNALGHLAYVLSGAVDVWSIRSERMRFEIDGEIHEDDYIFGAISNSTSLGGVLTIDPLLVDMNDGMLEVMLIKHPKTLNELLQIADALTRRQYECDMITFVSASHITVTSPQPTDWSLDGEKATAEGTFCVECLRDALNIYCGPSTDPQDIIL